MEVVNALGRRKSAVARIYVSEGTGKITVNKRDLAEYFPSSILQYVVKQPLNIRPFIELHRRLVSKLPGFLRRTTRELVEKTKKKVND